jgi:hypothetical protein
MKKKFTLLFATALLIAGACRPNGAMHAKTEWISGKTKGYLFRQKKYVYG